MWCRSSTMPQVDGQASRLLLLKLHACFDTSKFTRLVMAQRLDCTLSNSHTDLHAESHENLLVVRSEQQMLGNTLTLPTPAAVPLIKLHKTGH